MMREFGKFKGQKRTEKTKWEWFLEGEHEGFFVNFFLFNPYIIPPLLITLFIAAAMILNWLVLKILNWIHPTLYNGVSLYLATMFCGIVFLIWIGGVFSWHYPKLAAQIGITMRDPDEIKTTLSSKERKEISFSPYRYITSFKRIFGVITIPYSIALLYEYSIIP